MATCVNPDSSGYFVITASPTAISDCAYVIQSGTEVVASPFVLDIDAAVALCGAFAALWTLAYVLKLLRRQLQES